MKKWIAGTVSLVVGVNAPAMTLDEYLSAVQSKNKTFLSLEASQTAARTRYEQADLELSPFLNASASYLDDKSEAPNPSGLTTHQQVRNYSLGLAKKFSTGTQVSVTGSVQAVNSEGTSGGFPFTQERHTGTMTYQLSQSLWKDFFGAATRLRWERQKSQQAQEKTSYDLQAKQALIAAEADFWDLVYLQEEMQIRKDGLERARKIEGWVKSRVNNGIGDRADSLNAQALTSLRELQLLSAEDELLAARKRVADQIEAGSTAPVMQGNFEAVRPLSNFVVGQSGRVVRLDSYLQVLEARAKAVSAREAADTVRPDLVLAGQYKTNGYDSTDSKAISKMNDSDYPVTGVSLTLSVPLDWGVTGAVRDTAKQDALAASLKMERSLLEGETSWNELNRRHAELTKKIQAAAQVSLLQSQRASAERDKLSKGRSITSQVITAEQEAAEAALALTKMKAEQRKLESQGRLFVKVEDTL